MIEKIDWGEFMGWELVIHTDEDWGTAEAWEKDGKFVCYRNEYFPEDCWDTWMTYVEPRIHEKGMWSEYCWTLLELVDDGSEMSFMLIMSADLEQRAQALMRVLEGMDED